LIGSSVVLVHTFAPPPCWCCWYRVSRKSISD